MGRTSREMLTKKTIREQAAEILKERIIGGDIKPGDRIIEAELAEEFGVSRGPIREALRQLEEEGLITYQSHKGCIVRTLSYEELQEVYLLRSTLEMLAVKVCEGKLSAETEEKMNENLKKMGIAAEEKNLYQIISLDEEFHSHIVENAGFEKIFKVWKSLAGGNAAAYYTMNNEELVPFAVVKKNHERILNAFQREDVKALCEEIEEHYMVVPSTLYEMRKERREC